MHTFRETAKTSFRTNCNMPKSENQVYSMNASRGRINSGIPLHAANTTGDYMPVSIKEEINDNFLIVKTALFKAPNENFKNFNLPDIQDAEKNKYFKMNLGDNQNEAAKENFQDINKNEMRRKNIKVENNELKRIQNGRQNLMESFKVLTGTVDRLLRWRKIFTEFYYVEVFALVISIQEGNVSFQKTILLKDKRGPILQVQHYANDHIDISDFYIGQELRCVGHMVGPNVLHAVSIRTATTEELANLQRLCYICDHAIARSAANAYDAINK